jgi:hypothetical protein
MLTFSILTLNKRVSRLTRLFFVAGEVGFEPTHTGIRIRGLNHLTTPQKLLFKCGWGGRIRTYAYWDQNPVS